MLRQVRRFAEICAETLPMQEPVYEFGAYQVEGQEEVADLRSLFPGQEYVGTDMRAGPGVDRVIDLHEVNLPDGSVGSAFLLETLEHVEFPRVAVANLLRVLAPGGILVVTTPMNLPIHNYPHDYWRFTPEGMRSLLRDFPHVLVDAIGPSDHPTTVLAVAAKDPVDHGALAGFRTRLDQQQQFWRRLSAHIEEQVRQGLGPTEL